MEQKELCATAEADENTAPTEAELVPVTLNVRRDQIELLKMLGGDVFLRSILRQIGDDNLNFFLPLSVLTDEQKAKFVKGWHESNKKFDDGGSDRPWHEPWKWPQLEAIRVHGAFPDLWGRNWYVECEGYIFGDEDDFEVWDGDKDETDAGMDPKDRMLRFMSEEEIVRLTPEYQSSY